MTIQNNSILRYVNDADPRDDGYSIASTVSPMNSNVLRINLPNKTAELSGRVIKSFYDGYDVTLSTFTDKCFIFNLALTEENVISLASYTSLMSILKDYMTYISFMSGTNPETFNYRFKVRTIYYHDVLIGNSQDNWNDHGIAFLLGLHFGMSDVDSSKDYRCINNIKSLQVTYDVIV